MDRKEAIEKITAIQRRSHPRQGGVRETRWEMIYAFMTTRKSKVYHVVEKHNDWPWDADAPAKTRCGLGFWFGEWTNSRPKGKSLCKRCARRGDEI